MANAPVLTVSRLAALLRDVIEENFLEVWVEGELSNVSTPASGHCYFCLKDENAQVRGVLFRAQARLLRFRPENGLQVIAAGRLSLYPQRGEIQLVVDRLEPKGLGGLQVAFEQVKARLSAEGLFAPERKRALPAFPRTIGVVTSATGAAIHDILQVLRRRQAHVCVLLRSVRVQGEGAAGEIAGAIADLNRHGEADVLIVGRGGGSLEDLWAFNEEPVARAIFSSAIPVISAVGHEVDVTIADFVADLRAPTPSAAAEMVVRSRLEFEGHLDHLILRLTAQIRSRTALLREKTEGAARRLRSPRQMVEQWRRTEADLERRLSRTMRQIQRDEEGRLGNLAGRLDALSPLRTLARGYAIVFDEGTGSAVRDSADLVRGQSMRIRLSRGGARARVEEVWPEPGKSLDSPVTGSNN